MVYCSFVFSERGREGRLARLMWDTQDSGTGSLYGFGLDEYTALAITNAGTPDASGEVSTHYYSGFETLMNSDVCDCRLLQYSLMQVVGLAGVFFVDITEAIGFNVNGYFNLKGINAHYLTEGDHMNMATYSPQFAPWKYNLDGQEENENALTSDDIFLGNEDDKPHGTPELVEVAQSLFNSRAFYTWGRTKETNPRYYVDMWKTKNDIKAKGYGGKHPETGDFVISYSEMVMDMRPEL